MTNTPPRDGPETGATADAATCSRKPNQLRRFGPSGFDQAQLRDAIGAGLLTATIIAIMIAM